MKIGAITIGQAPRTDVTADIMDIFEGQVELKQAGGWTGLQKRRSQNLRRKRETMCWSPA